MLLVRPGLFSVLVGASRKTDRGRFITRARGRPAQDHRRISERRSMITGEGPAQPRIAGTDDEMH